MLIVIEERLPSLNEVIGANRNSWQSGSSLKKKLTKLCAKNFLSLNDIKFPHTKKYNLCITWYEPNRKRDSDNITSAVKFILDGAVMAGFIPDDSQKYIGDIEHHIRLDKEHPRIEVEFIEVNE